MRKLPEVSDEELVIRAKRAYFTAARKEGRESPDMPSNTSDVVQVGEKEYVELHNGNGILAVYRVRNDGVLKRLVRWPRELETLTMGPLRS
jgi:hypothetical protein